MATWTADFRADKEFKVAVFLYAFLVVVSALLLEFLAKIPFMSRDFVSGFMPFMFLLLPYILFSSRFFVENYGDWIAGSLLRKLIFPSYLILIYSIFSPVASTFSPSLFLRLLMWFFVPVLVFSLGEQRRDQLTWREAFAILALWLPIEYGQLAGYDIVFNKNIQIPALPFAAPAFGLYLFTILKHTSGVGFTFRLGGRDFLWAAIGLLMLAPLLIPLGTSLGFIRFSTLDLNAWKTLELLLGIYFLVALPEELLFRGIIQNLLGKSVLGRWGFPLPLFLAAVIFGFSHYNNFNPPDWRYVFLATIAGLVYGYVYIRTGKTTASALVHTGVNFCWAVLFKDTSG